MKTRTVSAIAHRGFSSAAPENTLAAFGQAVELGPEMMECDVRQSRDGRLVVIHDPTVDRTTNGKGRVGEMSLAELRELDAGAWFGAEFAAERIPTLEEVLDLSRGKVDLIIEIKEDSLEDEVADMVRGRGMSQEVLIASFHHRIGVRIPELDPRVPFIPLVGLPARVSEEEAVRLVDEAAAVNGAIFGVNYKAITPELVKATHAANMRLMAWTPDDEAGIRSMVDIGVDMIGSNELALLLRVLSEMEVRPAHAEP